MTQENHLTDFALQIFPEHGNNGIVRKKLVEKLAQGVCVDLHNGNNITFLLKEEPVESENMELEGSTVGILLLNEDKQVGSVKAVVYYDAPTKSQELRKYYSRNASKEIRGRGLITTATALLFQVLAEKGVKQVWGIIDGGINNIESIKTRLNTPNIVGGGFFRTEYRIIPLGDASYELYLITHLGQITETTSEDEFFGRLRQAVNSF